MVVGYDPNAFDSNGRDLVVQMSSFFFNLVSQARKASRMLWVQR